MLDVSFTLHDLSRTFITVAENLDFSEVAVKRLFSNDLSSGYIVFDVDRLRHSMQHITDTLLMYAQGNQEPPQMSSP